LRGVDGPPHAVGAWLRRRLLEKGNFPQNLWITLGKECQKTVTIGGIGHLVTD
jgi:hypothetical protein